MSANVNFFRSKFAKLKFEQLLAEKYFIETCFSKAFESRPKKEELATLFFKMGAYCQPKEGITLLDCNLSDQFCDQYNETTTTTSTTTTTTDEIR